MSRILDKYGDFSTPLARKVFKLCDDLFCAVSNFAKENGLSAEEALIASTVLMRFVDNAIMLHVVETSLDAKIEEAKQKNIAYGAPGCGLTGENPVTKDKYELGN